MQPSLKGSLRVLDHLVRAPKLLLSVDKRSADERQEPRFWNSKVLACG